MAMSMLVIIIIALILCLVAKALTKPRGGSVHYDTGSSSESSYSSAAGKSGERSVSWILGSLPDEYMVLNDVTIPDQKTNPDKDYTTQIDHVVVSPYGIFVIETKNYSGWIFGNEKSQNWKQTFKTTEGRFFYNPIKQNWGHIYALAERLRLKTSLFKPIVVFSDDCELHVESDTPVVYLSQLKGIILSYTQPIIPQSDVVSIFNRLDQIDLNGEEFEREHIESIGERFVAKQYAFEQGRCPRCGSQLVVRNGKYGAFYGMLQLSQMQIHAGFVTLSYQKIFKPLFGTFVSEGGF